MTVECSHSIGLHVEAVGPELHHMHHKHVLILRHQLSAIVFICHGVCFDPNICDVGICGMKCCILFTCFVYLAIYDLEIYLV